MTMHLSEGPVSADASTISVSQFQSALTPYCEILASLQALQQKRRQMQNQLTEIDAIIAGETAAMEERKEVAQHMVDAAFVAGGEAQLHAVAAAEFPEYGLHVPEHVSATPLTSAVSGIVATNARMMLSLIEASLRAWGLTTPQAGQEGKEKAA